MPKRSGGYRKKRRTQPPQSTEPSESEAKPPQSFVFRRGPASPEVRALLLDLRRVLLPNTALRLREGDRSDLKDLLDVAGPLGVTHFVMFRESRLGFVNVRFARTPRGPTVTFRLERFSLSSDVHRAQRRPLTLKHTDFEQAPLLILSNLDTDKPNTQLLVTMFRNLLPPLDVKNIRLEQDVKRVLLLDWNATTEELEWRHYGIRIRPQGVSRTIRRVIERRGRRAGALGAGHLHDVSELADPSLAATLLTSESEAEGPSEFQFERWMPPPNPEPSAISAGVGTAVSGARKRTTGSGRSRMSAASYAPRAAVRLIEVGPRMTMRLLKIEEGLSSGTVLYRAASFSARDGAQL